jgi:alanine dehydrogenase
MEARTQALTLGLPRMHKEAGERRDFLPSLVERLVSRGVPVCVERGIGSGMGLEEAEYVRAGARVVEAREAWSQDVVLVLRSPEVEEFEAKLRPGSTLISMLHFPTRPGRIRRLVELGVDAISLDSIADDSGARLVENMRAVAWNGLEAAFDALEQTDPTLLEPGRAPVRVTVMGAGMVGKHAVEAASKYGRLDRARRMRERGLPGVEVTVLGRDLTGDWRYMRERLRNTDLLVDATQRSDASRPLVPNDWIGWLPMHAVICDLVVDPYVLQGNPPTVRSLEGIPRGDLDQYVFAPDDPDWCRTIPASIPTQHRRTVASCYSWPGVHPYACMALYEEQLAPLLETLFERGGTRGLRPDGSPFERALHRAWLGVWSAPAVPEVPELEPVLEAAGA